MTDRASASPAAPQSFDVCGTLPRGMTLLEASAGTGKTFTIAALTARYVAEEAKSVDRLLVITFTRMATGELRERVRERLVRAADGLSLVLAGAQSPADDEIVRLLTAASRDEQRARFERLAKAIADFDAATIETTHGFCLQVLYGLGTAGDVDREVTLVEEVRDLMEEVVDDLYLRKFVQRPNVHGFTRSDAFKVASKVLDHPDAVVVPPLSEGEDLSSVRRRFAKAFADEMERRKQARKIMTYDDVLIRLRDTLRDPLRGPQARARLRDRYDVVLVDEFQDTDPVQWDIMRGAFGDGSDTTLVLIGDPKQAIYAFRGADVHAYLQAKQEVRSEWTLDVNWRSDQALLDAYDALFANAELGEAGIRYRRVHAAEANRVPRLVGAPSPASLRVRMLHAGDGLVPRIRSGQPKAAEARALIARDLADQTVALLSSGAQVITRRRDGTETGREDLHPGHLAVLVRSNAQANTVRDALHDAHVPAVIGGAGSVFASDGARQWLRLLEALERPSARDRASLVALGEFVGWSAEEVARADEDRWEELHWSLHRWAGLLREKGIAALHETVSAATGVPARVLTRPNGERFLTDVRHVAQLMHEATVNEGIGAPALATWLGRRIQEAERDADNEERTRRLESDARAVQVITIHRSKGLEFPVVLCPFAWDGYIFPTDVPVFHDPDNADRRSVDVGAKSNELDAHKTLQKEEEQGEGLRLLYVALTRARHHAIVWWVGGRDTKDSPLSRLLFDRAPDGAVAPLGSKKTPSDATVQAAFESLGAGVSVERVARPTQAQWRQEEDATPELIAARFTRRLDSEWRRTSYSGLTRALHDHDSPAIGSEPEEPLTADDESPDPEWWPVAGEATAPGGPATAPLGLASMPGGTLIGTLVHEVLRRTEFDAPDLTGALAESLAREVRRRNVDVGDTGEVIIGLRAAIEAPLGPTVGDLCMRDITGRDRLDELSFELPLAGGDRPEGSLDVDAMADLLDAHLGPGDPMRGYTRRLRDPSLGGSFRGYLTGSLDLVFRSGGRYVLADYKTNKLGPPGEVLTSWHYRPEALDAEMMETHYTLQALLYSVALHRYLRWRLPGYTTSKNLGPVLYLFLRGMSALEVTRFGAHPCGVWSWHPPAALVEALSDLFDQGRPR